MNTSFRVLVAVLAILGAQLARADHTYLNVTTGDWASASTWLGIIPVSTSQVYIGFTTAGVKTGTVTVTQSGAVADTTAMGHYTGGYGLLRVESGDLSSRVIDVGHFGPGDMVITGGTVSGTFCYSAYGSTGRGTMTVSGGTLTLTNSSCHVGYGGQGALTIRSNGYFRCSSILYVSNLANSYGRLNLEGGTFDGFGRTLYVAQTATAGSTGEVVVTGGVLTNLNAFQIGAASGSSGLLEIRGTNATLMLRDASGPDGYIQAATGILRVRLGKGGLSPMQARNVTLGGRIEVDALPDFDGKIGDSYNLVIGVSGTWTINPITLVNLNPHYQFSLKDDGTSEVTTRSYTIKLDWVEPKGTTFFIR